MRTLDWVVMGGTILFIILYGIYKSRGAKDIRSYLLSDNNLKWWTIGLSIMATQASAITFLSTPGQAFNDGMRFVQFYFGVPVAMVLISMIAIPIYRKLNVFTAYEYLEQRFDLKTRTLGTILFLIGRSLAAGITIVAPAIILEVLLGWEIWITCFGIGILVMVYTVSGGSKAVAQTQQQQMAIILIGMIIAGVVMVLKLPSELSFGEALTIAGANNKLNVISLPSSVGNFFQDKYNLLSGLIAGSFLALSYFGTDQSQVQRYLGGKSVTEIRIGLLFNGIFKVPMQFGILFIGAMMFVFYQFEDAPMLFNESARAEILASDLKEDYLQAEENYTSLNQEGKLLWEEWSRSGNEGSMEKAIIRNDSAAQIKKQILANVAEKAPSINTKDQDRIFLTFVLDHLPIGLVGLLMAVIFSAAMSSTAAELNALASTTSIDIYKRMVKQDASDEHYLKMSKRFTLMWGIFAILFAITAGQYENLIEYVNILGSLFYGTILGLFVVAFFMKKINGSAVFIGALISETLVLAIFFLPKLFPDVLGILDIGYLWLNLIGCILVMLFSWIFQRVS
ncbi:MAG: sodium:solute symporter [Bacteroidia bacterium]|nr:sodium:solute symporter [Bacteroidia bacterium]